jgi:microcystin-dependent protein
MADTQTPNVKFTLPEIGSSPNTWGNKINADWSQLDAFFGLPGTLNSIVKHDSQGRAIMQNAVHLLSTLGAAGATLFQFWMKGDPSVSSTNWNFRWANGVQDTETGGNTGSNWYLYRYDDAGDPFVPFMINRNTGVVKFETIPVVGADPIVTQSTATALQEPVGTVKMYAGNGDPPGGFYLICDGRILNTSAYAALFAAIGYAFGGTGSNFNLPNMAEKVVIGKSLTRNLVTQDTSVMGTVVGEGTHLLAASELPAHTHPITDPKHHHTITAPPAQFQGQSGGGGVQSVATGAGVVTTDAATGITQADANTGGGAAHNNVQPSIVMNFIIRVQ